MKLKDFLRKWSKPNTTGQEEVLTQFYKDINNLEMLDEQDIRNDEKIKIKIQLKKVIDETDKIDDIRSYVDEM